MKNVILYLLIGFCFLQCVICIECPSMKIRFYVKNLNKLRNCTSITGSLYIHAVAEDDFIRIKKIPENFTEIEKLAVAAAKEHHDDFGRQYEINNFTFPKLTEITGYLVLYSVKGLRSIGQLFPNLIVIRGQELVSSFALVAFDLPHLREIGLKSLISIQRGYVFIERVPSLCFLHTIDWEALTDENEEDVGGGKGNMLQREVKECPTRESCRSCVNKSCWSAYHCQRHYNGTNFKGRKCHKLCLGGCVNGTASGCSVCVGPVVNGTCVEKCPSHLFLKTETMRCVPADVCMNANLIPFNGECLKACPGGYSQQNPETNTTDMACFKCKVKCVNRCPGGAVRGASDLEYFRGCTVIEGSLVIKLGLNMTDINEKLEQCLGHIEEIKGSLRIVRSFSLTSLSFLRSLVLINAVNATQDNEYALEISENDNLQKLFDWKKKMSFEIIGGGMSFHFNSKLCFDEIRNFQQHTIYNSSYDSIQYESNGYEETCHAIGISTIFVVNSFRTVDIYWNKTDFGENKTLVGYFVYYLESSFPEVKEITYFSGVDACSPNSWQSIFIPYDDLEKESGYYKMTLNRLRPYTYYAYYIRTQISLKHNDIVLNVTQGQSPVKYFQTLPDRPEPPIVRTKEKTRTTITLEWNPSTPDNELIQKYIIDVYVQLDDIDEIDKRDYCEYPKVKEEIERKNYFTENAKFICCEEQRVYLDFFRREGNQTCGVDDATCENTFKHVVFRHHIEKALAIVNLQKPPSEQYQYKEESYESLKHYAGTTDPIQRKPEDTKHYLHSHIIDDTSLEHFLVANLKPFQLYMFLVFACNNITNCSDYYVHSDRTHPQRDADDVEISAVQDDGTDIVTLSFRPPISPNGATIAYEIEIADFTRLKSDIKCITRKQMDKLNYTYRFENLLPGTHAFRVRTLSLGDDGNFSKYIIVEVEKLSDSSNLIIWGISLTFVAVIAIIASILFYRRYRTWCEPKFCIADILLMGRRESEQSVLEPRLDEADVKNSLPQAGPTRRLRVSRIPSTSQTLQTLKRQSKASLNIPINKDIAMSVFKSNISASTESLIETQELQDLSSSSNEPLFPFASLPLDIDRKDSVDLDHESSASIRYHHERDYELPLLA